MDYGDTGSADTLASYDYYEYFIKGCVDEHEEEETRLRNLGGPFCPATYECFMCWPPTAAGHTATMSCPVELDEQFNLSGGSAVNYCTSDGNWTVTIHQCEHILVSGEVCKCHHCNALHYLMIAGYSVSLIALVLAFIMIVAIRALRVKRNKIHAHLLASFICLYTLSLFSVIFYFSVDPKPPTCQIIMMLLQYFNLCNFAWMSLEGFYLYALVVLAFRIDPDKINMWKYCLMGWGPPAIPVIFQSIVFIVDGPNQAESEPNSYSEYGSDSSHSNRTYSPSYPQYGNYSNLTEYLPSYSYNYEGTEPEPVDCWRRDNFPWQIYAFMITPMLLLLAMNVFFLAMILKVLLPKIKTTGKNHMRNHLKMLKSAIVLVVLLGTVYIVFLIEPHIKNVSPLVKYVMTVINTTLQATQGLAVAILYVFMNSEVQTKVSNEARRFSDRRLSSIKGLSTRPNLNGNGNSSVKMKMDRRLKRLRLGKEARNRASYASDRTHTFSLSDTSSIEKQDNGKNHHNGVTENEGNTKDLNSNGNVPHLITDGSDHESGDDDVFNETSLIHIEEKNINANGYVKLREQSVSETTEQHSEEAEALLVDVHL